MTYFFETYGCQMNKAESAAIEQLMVGRGWTAAETAETADLAIINTCSVRATAENRIFGRLGWFTALKAVRSGAREGKRGHFPLAAAAYDEGRQNLTLVVTGCMAQRLLDSLKKDYPVIDYVVGTFQKQHFEEIIQAVEQNQPPLVIDEDPVYTFAPVSLEPGAFTAFVPIMHGCNNYCTYCIVPHVRGREISRNPAEVLAELDQLSAHHVREITLLGQNVNSYCWKNEDGTELDFPGLMEMIARHLEEKNSPIGWVRFMSSHPKDLSDKLIEVIARYPVLCRHLHLPVQHGSDPILRRMARRYTHQEYLDLVGRIREKLPDASLTTDILIGFPGETEEDFDKTVELMERVRYQAAYMYYYNPREGTPAAKYPDQIPLKTKKSRLQRIIDMQLVITREETAKRLGQTVTVLAESVSRDNKAELLGKTAQDERVVFAAPESVCGSFVQVQLLELTGNTIRGKVVGS
ncbi:MAG: tRNA (N6-isopentenyl adenosine(37)-C2)-methylthiotransferase MiaB [Spirochaetaceae bacterium]|nr:tRNA (N6-isopentenyl adenosine(37)-C2)-methylthiotransferase MiaB [Spirochaetaceae bacterium]